MKKLLLLVAFAFCMTAAHADEFSRIKPVQFGVGINAGTNGAGLDASLGLSRFVQIRGGFSFVPKLKIAYKADVYNNAQVSIASWNAFNPSQAISVPDKMPSFIQPNMTTAHVLLDLYPGRSFHLTVGAYFGKSNVLRTWNKDLELGQELYKANGCIDAVNEQLPETQQIQHVGMQLGDYLFMPNAEGDIEAEVRVNKIRPYAGIGFGRAVPRKHRVGCSLDLGVQYWGKPKYFCNSAEVERADLKPKKYVKMATTLPVYPALTFRICGRIF